MDDIFMAWTKTENQLKSFISELNKKQHSIKLDFRYSNEQTEFLETLVYKDHNNHLYTAICKKSTDY